MKRIIVNRSIIAIFLISIAAGGVLANALDSGTKTVTVGPGDNGWFRDWEFPQIKGFA